MMKVLPPFLSQGYVVRDRADPVLPSFGSLPAVHTLFQFLPYLEIGQLLRSDLDVLAGLRVLSQVGRIIADREAPEPPDLNPSPSRRASVNPSNTQFMISKASFPLSCSFSDSCAIKSDFFIMVFSYRSFGMNTHNRT
jgi:hypothetical protein